MREGDGLLVTGMHGRVNGICDGGGGDGVGRGDQYPACLLNCPGALFFESKSEYSQHDPTITNGNFAHDFLCIDFGHTATVQH